MKTNIIKSNAAFMSLVWPVLYEICGGKIIPIETLFDNPIANILDTDCGCDYLHLVDGKGYRGIASRVQFGPTIYDTFTIRTSLTSGSLTGYDKRLIAIRSGNYIYPHFTCQAYVSDDLTILFSGAIARTSEIFLAINRREFTSHGVSDAEFIAIKFADVKDIKIF